MIKDFRSLKDIWNKLMYVLSKHQKKMGVVVFVLSLIGALFETLGVSVMVPMVQAMVTPQLLTQNKYTSAFLRLFDISINSNIIGLMCVLVVIVYVVKNAYLTFLSWARAKYASKIQKELSVKVMHSYMKRDYQFFLKNNVGTLVRGTLGDAQGVYSIIYQGFRIVTEVLTSICICIYIFMTDAELALSVIGVGVFCIVLMVAIFRNVMKRLGRKNWEYSALANKYMLEAYNGIKDVMVMHRQSFFIHNYEQANAEQQKASVGNTVAAESPAYIIEAICISGIIISLAFRINNMENPTLFVPQLAAFAIAAFRILPSMGKISNAVNTLIYHLPYLDEAYTDFKEVENADKVMQAGNVVVYQNEDSSELKFKNILKIQNIVWKYENAEDTVLNNCSLDVHKGESIGIIGPSGSGKSTLIDIILGLLKPQSGSVEMDDIDIFSIPIRWPRIIGYVPQTVYLTDDTIRNNVAFGINVEEISDELVWDALKKAHIDEFVRMLPDQLETVVGDKGVRFSGGQRQRIAIARALYCNPDILLFDEATSALDNETEKAVMESIDSLHGIKTLIIVAHRLTTIKNCDKVYEVSNGKIVRKEEI